MRLAHGAGGPDRAERGGAINSLLTASRLLSRPGVMVSGVPLRKPTMATMDRPPATRRIGVAEVVEFPDSGNEGGVLAIVIGSAAVE